MVMLCYERKKSMQTALCGKIKESRETGGEWLIETNAQHTLLSNCSNTTQDKTKASSLLTRVKSRSCPDSY